MNLTTKEFNYYKRVFSFSFFQSHKDLLPTNTTLPLAHLGTSHLPFRTPRHHCLGSCAPLCCPRHFRRLSSPPLQQKQCTLVDSLKLLSVAGLKGPGHTMCKEFHGRKAISRHSSRLIRGSLTRRVGLRHAMKVGDGSAEDEHYS